MPETVADIANNTFTIICLYTNFEFRLHALELGRNVEIAIDSQDFPGPSIVNGCQCLHYMQAAANKSCIVSHEPRGLGTATATI